ncbi:MAG TPA: ABC-2 transporter permease [Candidatus Latescibacteria bacterium]|nr:ABC-2 transporter permease [Candidatus Latescibacterota bacterium]
MSKPAIALLRKDLRITRILWAPMAFSFGVFLLMFMENVWVYLATGACLTFVAAATALGIDDRYRTESLLAALPGTRRSLVMARYLTWGMITTACLGLFLAYTALIQAGFGERALRLATLVSVKGAAAFLIGTVLTGLLFLPFHFRFGFWRGMWLFTFAGLGLTVIALYAAPFLVPAGACATGPSSALPEPFDSLARGLRSLAWLIDRYLSRPTVLAAAAVILTLSVYLSYRLSVRFCRKRDI